MLSANEHENTLISPFLLKLLLGILSEAAGQSTTTQREIDSVSPGLLDEAREFYKKALDSLVVSERVTSVFAFFVLPLL